MSHIIQSLRSTGIVTFKPGRNHRNKGQIKNRTLVFYVAGLQYERGQTFIRDLIPGESVKLVFEPENPHDSNAVALFARGRKIGYIPADRNQMVTELLDRQPLFTAGILEVNTNRPVRKQLKIKLEVVSR